MVFKSTSKNIASRFLLLANYSPLSQPLRVLMFYVVVNKFLYDSRLSFENDKNIEVEPIKF